MKENRSIDFTRAMRHVLLLLMLMLVPMGVVGADRDGALRMLRRAQAAMHSNPKEAAELANRALQLSDTSNPDTVCREATIISGYAEQLLGNFDLSIRILSDAEQMTDTTDTYTLARIYMIQGRVFSKLGDYSRANELNDRATSIFKSVGDSAQVAACYTQRGITLLNTNQYALAEHFFRKSLDISRRLRDLEGVARNLNNMCLYEGDSAEKLQMIDEAIAINKNLGSLWSLGENYNNKAKQLCYAGRYREALDALQRAYGFIEEIGARELLCDYYEYMGMANAGLGDYKSAYESMEKMVWLAAELQRRNSQRNTDLEIARQRALDQKHAAERQEHLYNMQNIRRNLVLIFCVLMLIAISCVFYYIWYKHKKNMELLQATHDLELASKEVDKLKLRQQELELENAHAMLSLSHRDLTEFAAFLKSRNEILERIREMVKEGYKLPPEAIVPHLKKISGFIATGVSNDNTSQTLIMKAEEKNKDFIQKLTARHPDLTKGSRHLALLIRGGLSTKEISVLLGLETKTVNMNRYRLRKALGIEQETDLFEYLKGL